MSEFTIERFLFETNTEFSPELINHVKKLDKDTSTDEWMTYKDCAIALGNLSNFMKVDENYYKNLLEKVNKNTKQSETIRLTSFGLMELSKYYNFSKSEVNSMIDFMTQNTNLGMTLSQFGTLFSNYAEGKAVYSKKELYSKWEKIKSNEKIINSLWDTLCYNHLSKGCELSKKDAKNIVDRVWELAEINALNYGRRWDGIGDSVSKLPLTRQQKKKIAYSVTNMSGELSKAHSTILEAFESFYKRYPDDYSNEAVMKSLDVVKTYVKQIDEFAETFSKAISGGKIDKMNYIIANISGQQDYGNDLMSTIKLISNVRNLDDLNQKLSGQNPVTIDGKTYLIHGSQKTAFILPKAPKDEFSIGVMEAISKELEKRRFYSHFDDHGFSAYQKGVDLRSEHSDTYALIYKLEPAQVFYICGPGHPEYTPNIELAEQIGDLVLDTFNKASSIGGKTKEDGYRAVAKVFKN